MFAKIGRDFVHIDDLNAWIGKLLLVLSPLGIVLPPLDHGGAITRGLHYKDLVEKGEDGTKYYDDIVEFNDEDEEAEVAE
jgi:hypothetical protein